MPRWMVAIVGIAIGLIMAVAAVLLAENMGFVSVVQTKHEAEGRAGPSGRRGSSLNVAPPPICCFQKDFVVVSSWRKL